MRGLVLTLYIGVFVALFGLGWGIDQYYNSIFENRQEQPYPGYRAALNIITEHIKNRSMSELEIENYLQNNNLNLILEPLDSIHLPESLISIRDRGEIFMLQSESADTLYQRIIATPWLLSLEIELSADIEDQNTRYVLTLLFYSGVAAILFLWLFPLLRGIQQLNTSAKEIGLGHLHTRVENPDSLFLSPLKKEFNAMAERLQQLNENNRLMSQAVSHELRTPLSRMRFAIDLLHGRKTQPQREQDMQRMEADLDDMEGLINELLNYSRLDKQPILDLQPIKIETLIQQRVNRHLEMGCNIDFEAHRIDGLIAGDDDYLCKVIDNLILNACRYASTVVLIESLWTNSQYILRVIDDGAGVPMDEAENIFKPFYRVKNQRVKKSGGFGLGLSIVKRIVQWHNGSITLGKSEQLSGAMFEIILPVSKQNRPN